MLKRLGERRPVTAEAAGSSPVSRAIVFNGLLSANPKIPDFSLLICSGAALLAASAVLTTFPQSRRPPPGEGAALLRFARTLGAV